MKKLINILLVFLLIGQVAIAQDIITVKELIAKKKDKNVVIVDCQKPSKYKAVHITGAINIYHKDLTKTSGPKGILKSTSEVAKILGSKGLSNTNTIVLYDNGNGKYDYNEQKF